MFNEKSSAWIKIYKVIIIVLLFACIIGGFIFASITGSIELAYFGSVIGGVAIGFFQYAFGMLIVNFLSNVQLIREHLDKK